ncbi:IclR family transcriptional regulator [Allokutzneria sp. NRRL B-24872]|uniref:IclR family transcriptional regulator n=1 Tax=Allokutzneria sp. NRRL B-24872 TaxID=1137961 RepID=UPI0011783ECD|nr:IclR family transcriptional regulator [Allokutzneria sp. NRRL B-24872]
MTAETGGNGRSSSSGNAVEKALRVLEAVSMPGSPHRLAEIAATAGVPKPSAHRILGTFAERGFVHSHGGGRYAPGPRLRAMAAQVAGDDDRGVDQVLAELQRQVGHTVHLALRAGDRAVYTHKVEADQPFRTSSRIGMWLPLHSTAIGKCVLAHLGVTERDDVLGGAGLARRTPATITEREQLDTELAEVRRRGYAVDDEENEASIRCVAAPLLDASGRPVGAVSVSGVAFLVSREQIEAFAPEVRHAAQSLAAVLF